MFEENDYHTKTAVELWEQYQDELKARFDRIESLALLGAKNVLSVKDAALLTGRSEKTIRNNLRNIPHYYGPMGVCFDRSELEAWMKGIRRTPIPARI